MLSAVGIEKAFGPVRALAGVSFEIRTGEVHGLIGENGAGKSTLLKILSGILAPDRGQILLDGQGVSLSCPADAQRAGIAVVHQELNLVDDLNVAENLFLGSMRGGILPKAEMERVAREALPDLEPNTRVGDLSLAQKQRVEIARATATIPGRTAARFLILDEPTAVLGGAESEALLELMGRLAAAGTGVVFVSHHLHEVEQVCGRVTVLRDGAVVGELPARSAPEVMAEAMVGRALEALFPGLEEPEHRVVLEAEGAFGTLSVRAGEIVGLAGLVGAGRTELLEAMAGLRAADGRGEAVMVRVNGQVVSGGARARMAAGIAAVPEERKTAGLHLDLAIGENMAMPRWEKWARPVVQREQVMQMAAAWQGTLAIRMEGAQQPVGRLSGGNQQKVALAKWLDGEPDVLLLDEPTRGVDVGSKAEIYGVVAERARAGLAIVVAGSELGELLGLCHRVAVMREGRIAGILERSELSEEAVMRLATGTEAVSA